MPKKYIITLSFLIISTFSFGQLPDSNSKKIIGFVFENSIYVYTLIPVVEADIIIEGTERKTKTDTDGKFEIEAKEGEKLIVTGLGIRTKELLIETKNCYKITLDTDLEDYPISITRRIARINAKKARKIEQTVKRKTQEGFYDCLD
ncbi:MULTISPECIES: carboxypeptidase-like regulatory domain-containing protein [unclassified Flavobacterium]|uniref:carboxypeptidase-like regulatory domain-containing protein n=1 Tax=unclassified Flavobacterium TaxID=196869 RepID=UPI000969EC3F|nr:MULTISPECIES: carboxypeptidase-like regulatory domain-containing protein [unclassified Flavobacterium]MBN9285464.1 carboxypeptidase-like regulatory domain-containing protein [Flavobacterium sp.]OJV71455.1 MAG: hypothetical protein BGO42_06260 [Flavobacterium sp. 40-81]